MEFSTEYIFVHSLYEEMIIFVPKIFKKQLFFNQIYIFEFKKMFGVQKDPTFQILGQN